MYDFKKLELQIEETHEWLRKEYQGLRTGRATPALLDTIQVESYGSRMPLNQVANIGVEDARTLRVTPWDASQVKDIEKAITVADFGVGVVTDSTGVRVIFPELTTDRRESLKKVAKTKLEDARQSLRGIREDAWGDIQTQMKEGVMSEDEKFRAKEQLQKYVDSSNEALESNYTNKEKEIMQ